MQKPSKRKLLLQQTTASRSKSSKVSSVVEEQGPFPSHPRPTPQDCRAVRDSLLSFHGFPPQFAHYREQRLHHDGSSLRTQNSAHDSGGDSESVLDGLVKALLSQNTTEFNSLGAFSNLKSAFPTWEDALAADKKHIENAIRSGGLAPTKASYIKNILTSLLERKGKLCLEYLRDLSTIEIKAELSHFKGIGPKTVACVLMFNLQRDDFPVDTHVYEIAKSLGWVPYVADRNKTYIHLNQRIPNELKFDLNCLLYTHGKLCQKCTKKGSNWERENGCDDSCPLLEYC
ncbi:hypothetical protein K2173_028119 [Erythroxylum novogranatense]|uniref:HhH-GPD domain-containing protein n=1 Tax=Erythroxylum novogranatense TaxID=1862640 RepID=A0AAV8U0W1_9ROSI|nr:hypothetical protein K2173_028119 [Erythroxylum novogranatense]